MLDLWGKSNTHSEGLCYPCRYMGGFRCEKDSCEEKASEYALKKDAAHKKFRAEKERVLAPIKGILDTELFLLERQYLIDESNRESYPIYEQ